MKRHLLSRFLLIFCLIGAVEMNAQTTPLQFNDNFSAIADSLFTSGQNWGLAFNKANETKSWVILTPYRETMERIATTGLMKVKAMKDVSNSAEFHKAMIAFLEFEKDMVELAFKPMEMLRSTATQDEIKTAFENLKSYAAQEGAALQKLTATQDAYANANGFKIKAAGK